LAFGSKAEASPWQNYNPQPVFWVDWNPTEGCYDITFEVGVVNPNGSTYDYFASFSLYVNDYQLWNSPNAGEINNNRNRNFWYYYTASQSHGHLDVWNYYSGQWAIASTAPASTQTMVFHTGGWQNAPNIADRAVIQLKYYPTIQNIFNKDIEFKAKARVSASGGPDYTYTKTVTPDLASAITLSNLQYNEYGVLQFYVDRNSTDRNIPKLYLAAYDNSDVDQFSEEIGVPAGYEDFAASSDYTKAIPEKYVTQRMKYRLVYGWPDGTPAKPGSAAKLAAYWRYSDPVTLPAIHLPKNIDAKYLGDGKVEIKWDVVQNDDSNPQSRDNMILDSWINGAVTRLSDENTASNDAARYSQGSYIYTIPAEYYDKGNLEIQFEFKRYPFTANNYAKWVKFQQNMNYLKPQSVKIKSTGASGLTLEWNNDNGFFLNAWKYRLRVVQGAEEFISTKIDAIKTDATVTVGSTILTCNPVEIYLELVNTDQSDNVLVSTLISSNFAFSTTASTIESLAVSKGFYPTHVQLNWKTSSQNQFSQYVIFRKQYGSEDEGYGDQIGIVNHSSGNTAYTFSDDRAVPGTFYTYRIEGQASCGQNNVTTADVKEDIGYIQPYGFVSGRISYSGGKQGVQYVSVIAEGDSKIQNKAFDFATDSTYIKTPHKDGLMQQSAFGFQAWLRLRKTDETTPNRTIVHKPGQYAVEVRPSENYAVVFLTPHYSGGSVQSLDEFKFTDYRFPVDTFVHLSVTFGSSNNGTSGTAILYVNGAAVDTVIKSISMTVQDFSTYQYPLYIGRWDGGIVTWNGYVDELRLWNRVLTPTEISQNYNCYISGKEDGLSLYYRFDELNSIGSVYDISGIESNNKFNENHGTIVGRVGRTSQPGTVPRSEQLGIKGTTDAEGNYTINTVPYTGAGNTYNIVPLLGVHEFSPTRRPLFFGPSSTVHNSIDFTDESSFKVSGTVVYEGGDYPVENCEFEVDGMRLMEGYGPVRSASDGTFAIKVPIGVHEVRIVKAGHAFLNDGRLLNPLTNGPRNYNDSLSGIRFYDQTRVKLIGHIVGGKREHEKPSGFGLRINNIGSDELKLAGQKSQYKFRLQPTDTTITFKHHEDKWAKWTQKDKDGRTAMDSSHITIAGKDITIHVSPQTGEYVAWVYPEKYNIQPISVSSYGGITGNVQTLDLSDAAVSDTAMMLKNSVYTYTDSVYVPPSSTQPGHMRYFEVSDTVLFHSEWSHYHLEAPSYSVKQLKGATPLNYFGLEKFRLDSETEIPLVTNPESDNPSYVANLPVFLSHEPYRFELSAFEYYENGDIKDKVPVTGGVSSFSGTLLNTNDPLEVELDSIGKGVFEFYAGQVNLEGGQVQLTTSVRVDGYSYYSTLGAAGLTAYLFGGIKTGSDFMTAAGDKIDFILHDPPGSNSYAYIEAGSTATTTDAWEGTMGAVEEAK
jgi:hypothetical protein